MPAFLQVVTYVVPARYFLIALRGIVLKGAGLDAFWPQLVALAVFAAVVLALASVRLRRQWSLTCDASGSSIWKELIELRQDPRLFGIVIIAPILQLFMLGYAATTDVRNVPIVVVDADRSTAEPRADRALRRVAELHASSAIVTSAARHRSVSGARRARGWRSSIPRRLRRGARPRPAADGAGARRRQRRELDGRRARLRDEPDRGVRAGARADAAVPAPAAPPPAAIEPRVRVWFNPQLESRDFMMPGVDRAAAAGDHDEPVVDGDRARAGARHARAAERDAAAPLGADRRQAAAVRADRASSTCCLVLAVAVLWFEVPLRGSVWLLLALTRRSTC